MPEGDTVWLAGRRLHQALSGHRLTGCDFRVPQLATVDLTGRSVLEVASRGKHLLTRFDDGQTLHTHFRMDGSWHLYRPGQPWRGGPASSVRVVLTVPERVAVGYRLPVVELVATTDEGTVVGHLGPDLLAEQWGAAERAEVLRRLARDPSREIRLALLDQTVLAGLGNLYTAELCFLRGLSPWLPVGHVDDRALAEIIDLGRRLLWANRQRALQTTTGETRRGRTTWVFERYRQPCRRCGTAIRRAEQGPPGRERVTYWCPSCQPSRPEPAG